MDKHKLIEDRPIPCKYPDYSTGSLWQDNSSYNSEDETYAFYGKCKEDWIFLGRFKHFTSVTWDRIEGINLI